jgi:signal transduction histidine kinase
MAPSADVEQDPAFKQELLPASRAGLNAVGAAEAATGLFLAMALWPHAGWGGALVGAGAATFAAAAVKTVLPYGRWATMASVWAGTALVSGGAEHDFVEAGQTVILLTAAGTAPLPPWFAGLVGVGAHAISVLLIPASATRHVYFLMLTALATAIAFVRYSHRSGRFAAHLQALKENEILSTAQLRAQLSENAVSVARLGAALTHELNTPLGALKSAVESLLSVSKRCATAPPDEQEKLSAVQRDLQRSIETSALRIQAVVERLRRFSEVEQSDLQEANVGALIEDATLRLDEETRRRGPVEFEFTEAPPVICRPQQLTTVFTNLLSNALHAINGGGRVVVRTEHRERSVEVAIRDNGRGMTSEELDRIFDPGFRVEGSRIASGNWSLFSARQIIYEHGGDIAIESTPGIGTTVRVTLPV